ncbi:MAG: D-alanyl-D-alanine carboxypeptidase [Oscillospiraceae bacterium]|nr:D-alanyl-D-alanine carboxypeptidase [Oscillospiraceae bacterium]
MQKRLLSALLAVCTAVVMLCNLPAQKAHALLFTPNSTVQSDAAILMNLDVGQIVYEKNADRKEYPAALSQIMTAVVVLENCADISSVSVTATEEMSVALNNEEHQSELRRAGILPGDTLTVEDLLYAMMLTSSCEADYMLSEKIGGSLDGFIAMMNAKAEELGMEDTRFTTAGQLYSPRQLSTARDMMKLLSYAMTLPRFETIACANSYTPPGAAAAEKSDIWNWTHSNLMVEPSSDYYCNGVRGIKTGNSEDGGRSIACKASRDGINYLLICMNAPLTDAEGENHFYHLEDASNILEWAFLHLSFQDILSEMTELGEIKVVDAKGKIDYVKVRPVSGYSCIWCDTTDINSVKPIGDWPTKLNAPVYVGTKLGTVTLKLSGETLAEIDVVASYTVERSFWQYNLHKIPGFFTMGQVKKILILGIVLSLIYIGLCVFFAFRYHEDRKRRAEARAGYYRNKK